MSGLTDEIQSRGHWQVVIRPEVFDASRVPDVSALCPIVQQASVQLGGWDFPHIDRREQPIIDLDWAGQETRWNHYLEIWRLYQSGQFVHLSGFKDDWRDQSHIWPPDQNWVSGQRLGIGTTIFRFTEIFEFAARISMTAAGDESMHIEVTLRRLAGRVLWVDAPNRMPLAQPAKATIDEFPYLLDLPRTELAANARDLAVRGAVELFKRFGWDRSVEAVKGWQSEFGRR